LPAAVLDPVVDPIAEVLLPAGPVVVIPELLLGDWLALALLDEGDWLVVELLDVELSALFVVLELVLALPDGGCGAGKFELVELL
jgi:hypothetical protein